MIHSLEEISEKLNLGIFTKIKNDEEIKNYLDDFLYFFVFLDKDERSYIKKPITIEGKKFYEEFNEYSKLREKDFKYLLNRLDANTGDSYVSWEVEQIWEVKRIFRMTHDIMCRLQRMIINNDALNRFNLDILTLLFAITNIWDVLGKFGIDKEITETSLTKNDTINDLIRALRNEIGYKKVLENNKEIVYTKILSHKFSQKYSSDINRMYELYYANYSKFNLPTYLYHELVVLFQNSILLNIDVDELLKKYSNITRDEILTLCLYKLDMETFNRYLELLNNCNAKNKNMILEFIKPMNLYFPYLNEEFYDDLINKDIYYGSFKSELLYDRYFSYDLFNTLLNGDYDRKHHYTIKKRLVNEYSDTPFIFPSYALKSLYFDTEENSKGDLLRKNFYDGYFYYILRFQNLFKEQISVLEQITKREDASIVLLSFLEIKKFILDNRYKTKQHLTTRIRKFSHLYNENHDPITDDYSPIYKEIVISSLESSKIKEFFEYCQKYFKTYTMDKNYNNNDVRDYILKSLENIAKPKEEIIKKVREI